MSCSSTKKENPVVKDVDISETLVRDYDITEATSAVRPGWISDASEWAKANGMDTSKDRFFSFETEPKVSREMACHLAKANAKADIAGEVATFIRKTLGSSEEGQAAIDPNNPITQPLRSFVENNLVEKVQEVIVGAQVDKTHWEKRSYKVSKGARRDYIGYTCAALIKVKAEYIQSAIDLARSEMLNRTSDKEMKEKVKEALKDAETEFDTMRGVKP
jgi:hypothetical protein